MNSLGIYEKAVPFQGTWLDTFKLIKELGFNYMEFSVDESDERLARLDWSKEERKELLDASFETGIRIHTLMLSGHRRFPLGSSDPEVREHSIEMLRKAVNLACDLGIRNIQMAGYDVYYEEKTVDSRALFVEGLRECVEIAASKGITLAIETMDDPFLNNTQKIADLKREIRSPWLQAYPDLGNISAWPENDVAVDLENNIDYVTCIHLKDTLAVTEDFEGKFKEVPFGAGCVDFMGCLRTLKRIGYTGGYTIEMWTEKSDNAIDEIKAAKAFFEEIFEEVGIEIEPIN
ncbi:xylulose 5-phosphate 3-epimerase [Suicoccus acidiformans]|uniref:L-ribulose-5-phosphate 3-epimerase n=1 Tax=Suicoccus acidiformans TaxID=2036206 RepID=A0A347WII5_9LACT|nr:L-ribulose-5-phosphate 3-epimerase [Suicoccus acidiformans]AXY24892.1 xylulose 5-phosphate 3-epimerase [Suicoccus acidiformans]